MADPGDRIDVPRSAPQLGATPAQARWSWAIAAAIVVAFGLAFYAFSAHQRGEKVANHRAVMAAPATAAGTRPPAPQTTTGQAAPSTDPSTSGRGGGSPPQPR
ncbi:MAG TPA: hypothetical protein VH678_00345 [Xanthobacteraceae bacterium]|jgi:hypothetical protein